MSVVGEVLFKESNDGGLTFGAAVTIWNYSLSDSLGAIRGIDCSYNNSVPNVVFEVCHLTTSGSFEPNKLSKLMFWSPVINGGILVLVDSARGLTGSNGSNDVYLSVSRPVIGYSNPSAYTYVAYSKARTDTNSNGYNFFDTYITYSSNNGLSWVFTPAGHKFIRQSS